MQLSILLLAFYCLNILYSFLAFKSNIKYQIADTQRKIKILADKTIKMKLDKQHKQRLQDFCKTYAFLFKKYTLIGLLLSRKPAHSIVLLFSIVLSYYIGNFNVHWAARASIPLLSSLISIAIQYEYYKYIFLKDQQESINKISKLISSNKIAIVIYTSLIIFSQAVLLSLIYLVLSNLKDQKYVEILIRNGFILGLDNIVYKPLTFFLIAKIASQSPIFLQMIYREDEQHKIQKEKRQLELKGVINFSQQHMNEFVKDGDYQLKQTRNMFVSSIYNKKYEPQNQLIKSKSINQISKGKQFFFFPEDKSNSRVKKEQFKLKRQKTAHFFAINQLQINTQWQLEHEHQTKSLQQSTCQKITNTHFYNIRNIGKAISGQETKTLTECDQNRKMFTNQTQNTLSDIQIQNNKKQQDQKRKFSKPDKHRSKQHQLMKVQQVQTQMQEDLNQFQLKEHSTNTVHRYRARKRRPTALHSQLQQQNLIKIYFDGNKRQIKNYKPRRRQSQIAIQISKRNITGKHINSRSKPIVHQSQQQPNFFKLNDL